MDESTTKYKKVQLSKDDITILSKEDIFQKWQQQDEYLEYLERKHIPERDAVQKSRLQNLDTTRRENVLVMRLTTKEQEIQELLSQINELKSAQTPGVLALRNALLDPAINLMVEQMKKQVDIWKTKTEEIQNELSAWKFTTDSNTGKRLMAKCRLLIQENEELGKVISSGRLAKLEGELALQRNFIEEMKKSQSETDDFMQELDEDVEGMQSTIYYLQQQLREAKDANAKLEEKSIEHAQMLSVELRSPSTPDSALDVSCTATRTASPQIETTIVCNVVSSTVKELTPICNLIEHSLYVGRNGLGNVKDSDAPIVSLASVDHLEDNKCRDERVKENGKGSPLPPEVTDVEEKPVTCGWTSVIVKSDESNAKKNKKSPKDKQTTQTEVESAKRAPTKRNKGPTRRTRVSRKRLHVEHVENNLDDKTTKDKKKTKLEICSDDEDTLVISENGTIDSGEDNN